MTEKMKQLIEKILKMSPERIREWLEKRWQTIINSDGETAELLAELAIELAMYYEHPTLEQEIELLVKLTRLFAKIQELMNKENQE